MNILQILPELNVGGVERGTVDFSKYLVQKGHKAVVVSNGGVQIEKLKECGAKHYQLPVHKKSLFTMVRSIKPLREIIINEKIDIVHARSRVPGWIAYFACRKTQASFIATCHGYYKNKIWSQVMGWSKLVIVPSEIIGRHMIDHYKVSAKNIRCIPRSVDLDNFNRMKKEKKGNPEKVIAIVGRITPLKGHKFFLQAMAKVIRNMPYIRIWIIGDVPKNKNQYLLELETLAKRLGIQKNVEFLGRRENVAELLSDTDLLVMSSVEPESFGRVILEAQAVGVPVVSTNVGGVVDIIEHEHNGLLVFPKDTDGMARECLRVLKDPELSKNMVIAAKKKIKENFLLEHMASKTMEVYEELLRYHNILVIKLSSMGDVVLVTASLKALRKKYSKSHIYCLVGKESRKILQNCPYIDGIILYDAKHKDRGLLGILRIARKLRKYRFDKVVDFQNNRKSHIFSCLSFPRESYGYNNGKLGFLLSETVKDPNNEMAAVPHQFQVLNMLGIEYSDNCYLELWPSLKDKQYVKGLLDSEWLGNVKNIVGINISASEKWQTKNWSIQNIARLCDMLSTRNIRVIITGMEKDKELANQLLRFTKSKPAIFVGKTDIVELAALIKECKAYITPDSAPLHVAAAMQTPCIALFGPTNSDRHIPPAKSLIVLDKKLQCSPCYNSQCNILTHACMNEISPLDVFEKVQEIMSRDI